MNRCWLDATQTAPPGDEWLELARVRELAVVVDLESALRPLVPAIWSGLDRPAAHMLDGLAQTGARVVLVSDRSRAAVDAIRRRIPNAWWAAESGAWGHDGSWAPVPITDPIDWWVLDRAPRCRLVAIGELPIQRFGPIGPFEIASSTSQGKPRILRKSLPGTIEVRAFLWWLARARSDLMKIELTCGHDA